MAILLLSSLCSAPALAASLTVTAGLSDDFVYPGIEVFVSGTVKDDRGLLILSANVLVTISGTDISANATTDDRGMFYTSFNAPLDAGNYSVNVSAEKDGDSGQATLSLVVEINLAPDISISGDDITFWPNEPVTDTKVLVNATIRNIGDAGAETTIKLFVGEPFDGKLLFSNRTTVPAGGSVMISEMWPAESGFHLFTLVADQVDPSDKNITNNQANSAVEVKDILPPTISEPQITPEEPTSMDALSVLVQVEDDMGMAKDDPVVLIFTVGGGDEEKIPMNETVNGFLAEIGPFPGGTFVSLKINATDQSNNSAETDWYRLDIYYSSINVHVANQTVTAGQNISVYCSAEYEDKTPLPGQEAVLVLDGVSHYALTDNHGEASFNITAPDMPGKYDFTVFVNEKRLRANASAMLTVIPATHPDVMIVQGGLTFSWKNTSEVEVTVILCNRGDASGEVFLEVFLGSPSNGILLNGSNFTIAPGQFLFHTFIWSPQPGHHALVAIARCPTDIDLGNNIATAEVTIPVQDTGVDDGDVDGEDVDIEDSDENAAPWTFERMLILLALGLLILLVMYASIAREMERRKSK